MASLPSFLLLMLKKSVHELNAPHFPDIKLLVFLENRKVSDKRRVSFGAKKGAKGLLHWRGIQGFGEAAC